MTEKRQRGKHRGAREARSAKELGIRHCKHCGCSEYDACWDKKMLSSCGWVSEDECSVCRPDLLDKL